MFFYRLETIEGNRKRRKNEQKTCCWHTEIWLKSLRMITLVKPVRQSSWNRMRQKGSAGNNTEHSCEILFSHLPSYIRYQNVPGRLSSARDTLQFCWNPVFLELCIWAGALNFHSLDFFSHCHPFPNTSSILVCRKIP